MTTLLEIIGELHSFSLFLSQNSFQEFFSVIYSYFPCFHRWLHYRNLQNGGKRGFLPHILPASISLIDVHDLAVAFMFMVLHVYFDGYLPKLNVFFAGNESASFVCPCSRWYSYDEVYLWLWLLMYILCPQWAEDWPSVPAQCFKPRGPVEGLAVSLCFYTGQPCCPWTSAWTTWLTSWTSSVRCPPFPSFVTSSCLVTLCR